MRYRKIASPAATPVREPNAARTAWALLVALPGVAAHAAFGLCLGELLPLELAVLLTVALPWMPQALAAAGAPTPLWTLLRGCLPDAAGPLHPRTVASGHPVVLASVAWRLVGDALQTAAWAAVATGCFARDRRARREVA